MRASAILFTTTAALLAVTPLALAVAQPPVKKLAAEGVTLALPAGWSWTAKKSQSLALALTIKGGGLAGELRAGLSFFKRTFLGQHLDRLEALSRDKQDDQEAWKFRYHQTFAGQRGAVLVTFVRTLGEGPKARKQRVQLWLFRRYGHLYEWREECPQKLAARAHLLFKKVRKNLHFGRPQDAVVEDARRDYLNQKLVFKRPRDWSWWQGSKGARVRIGAKGHTGSGGRSSFVLLFSIRSEAFALHQRVTLYCGLAAIRAPIRPLQQAESMQRTLSRDWQSLRDIELKDKLSFRGKKAVLLSFRGIPAKRPRNSPVAQVREFLFKHKGTLFLWTEQALSEKPRASGTKQVLKRFQQARKQMVFY